MNIWGKHRERQKRNVHLASYVSLRSSCKLYCCFRFNVLWLFLTICLKNPFFLHSAKRSSKQFCMATVTLRSTFILLRMLTENFYSYIFIWKRKTSFIIKMNIQNVDKNVHKKSPVTRTKLQLKIYKSHVVTWQLRHMCEFSRNI